MKAAVARVFLAAALTVPAFAQEPDAVLRAAPSSPLFANAEAIQSSQSLLILVAKDSLDPADFDLVRRSIATIYRTNHAAFDISLGILRSGAGLDLAGPFRSAGELQLVLRKTVPGDAAVQAPPNFLTDLTASLAAVPALWTPTILIGRMPQFPDGTDSAVSEYASAWLLRRLIAMKRSLVVFDPSGREPGAWLTSASAGTGGTVLRNPEDLTSFLTDSPPLLAIRRNHTLLTHGFDVETVPIQGSAIFVLPAQSGLPEIAAYSGMRATISEARAQLAAGDLTAAGSAITRALAINPADRDAVAVGLDLAERSHDNPRAIALLETSVELAPKDAVLWSRLGDLQFREKDLGGAETSLMRARELGAASAVQAEQLGRIRFGRGDLANALTFMEESLRLNPAQQQLWFVASGLAKDLGQTGKRIDSLEHGLALGGGNIPARAELIELYLAKGDTQNALRHVDIDFPTLPADAATQATWADFYERLGRPSDALMCWKKAAAADPKSERAHFGVAGILLDRKDYAGALEAAEHGLEAVPSSGRLELVKTRALEMTGRIYDARLSLAGFAPASTDVEVLKRQAELTDVWGGDAPAAFRLYAETLIKTGAPKSTVTPLLQRGWKVALREHDLKASAWFEEQLASPPKTAAKTAPSADPGNRRLAIPGGMDALAFIARGRTGSDPETFLVDYCRTLLANMEIEKSAESALYRKSISNYFDQLRRLLAMSVTRDDRATLTLTLATKQGQSQTEAVLNILGWKLRRAKQQITVEAGEKAGQSEKQDLASALLIDRSAMQSAFQQGKAFELEIPFDWVGVNLDSASWKTILQSAKYSGGAAESLSQNTEFAQLFIGLNSVDSATASVLAYQLRINTLGPRYAQLLARYSSALTVSDGRVLVPGGANAEGAWTKLTGASPADAQRFFRALFDKDEGRVFAWFFALSQLDLAHQRFLTLTSQRMDAFYQAFLQSPDMQTGAGSLSRSGGFVEFLREIPLNGETVDFPGSAEVWMVAKGRSASGGGAGRMLRKARRAVAPEVEDEILLRLARTRNKKETDHVSETDNFLAVVRVEEHRTEPLDDESALLLAQNFNEFESFYPYFAVFKSLNSSDFTALFQILGALKTGEIVESDLMLGQIESLAEILRLSIDFGGVPEEKATAILRSFLKGFAGTNDSGVATAFVLDAVRALTGAAPEKNPDTDVSLKNLLLGRTPAVQFEWKGIPVTLDDNARRQTAYGRVLDLQKVPSLAALLRMDDALRQIAAGNGSAASLIDSLQKDSQLLPPLLLPKTNGVESHARHALARTSPAKIVPILAEMRQKIAKKKINRSDLQKLCHDAMFELAPQVRAGLTGIVYAAYLNPESTLVANDPLLVRKHQSFELRPDSYAKTRYPLSQLQTASAGEGSYFLGGFGQFAVPAATASTGLAQGSNSSLYVRQMASNHMASWNRYRDSEQLLLGLKIRLAREWFVYAAEDPALLAALGDDMHGILSLTRRRVALSGIAAREWSVVWDSVTLSDLLFLADRYLERYPQSPWPSPVAAALRQAAAQAGDDSLQTLASVPSLLRGCDHPHLLNLGPYEEYQGHLFPAEVAERTAELKLYLAETMDRHAVPAASMPSLIDAVSRRTFLSMRMSDERDWSSAIKAFRTIDERAIGVALEAQR